MSTDGEPGWEPDFVVGDTAATVDEDLPEPGPPQRGSRALFVVAVLAVVGLVVGVVVARSGDDTTPSSIPKPTSSSTVHPVPHRRPTQHHVIIHLDPSTGTRLHIPRIANPRTTCPEADDGSPACVVSNDVPARVVEAVHAQFPKARVTQRFEEDVRDTGLGPGGLWFRRVTWLGHVASGSVIVRQRATGDRNVTVTHRVRRGNALTAEYVSTALTVEVTLVGKHLPRMRLARRAQVLAHDPVVRASRRM